MKNFKLLTLATLILFVFSCQKDQINDVVASNEVSEIEFKISHSNLPESLKSSKGLKSSTTLDDAKIIVFTIQNSIGESTDYTSEKMDVYKIGDNFFSQKISLGLGEYKLTEFLLLDKDDNTIYATPLSGSLQAQNVENPLSVNFSINKDQITSVLVEVLSTESLTPEDFGLVGFPFSEIETFSFLINVSEIGQMDSLITSSLIVTSETYTYVQALDAIANNVVTIKDGYSEYTLTISKTRYVDYSITLSNDILKEHTTKPLTIELELEELVETVTDIDGNVYNTVTIGTQVWLTENLKTTKYNDSTAIPNVTDGDTWGSLTTPAYCWYNTSPIKRPTELYIIGIL